MAQLGQDFSKITTSCLDDYIRDTNSIRAGNPVKNYIKNIDWEQRRYEIAKDVLSTLVSDPILADCEIPSEAVRYADALIKELKK